ncbi:hypothetical protein NUACC21_22020 [Scytonema sp. NUACC21]
MTLSEDLNIEQSREFNAATPSYPVIFGISLTPKVSGIALGFVGIAAAVYMVMNMLMPTWDTFQQQQAKQTEIQTDIDQKKAAIKQIDKVKQEQLLAKQQQVQVLGLFANEKTLDTLLLDINRLVESGNSQVPANGTRAKLKKYVPASGKAEPIMDGSLGPLVNGKLKRTNITIDVFGTYEQTQSILRNIERLQPLLIVKDYQSALAPEETSTDKDKPIRRIGSAPIRTSFQLQALMPMSPEETAKAIAAKK